MFLYNAIILEIIAFSLGATGMSLMMLFDPISSHLIKVVGGVAALIFLASSALMLFAFRREKHQLIKYFAIFFLFFVLIIVCIGPFTFSVPQPFLMQSGYFSSDNLFGCFLFVLLLAYLVDDKASRDVAGIDVFRFFMNVFLFASSMSVVLFVRLLMIRDDSDRLDLLLFQDEWFFQMSVVYAVVSVFVNAGAAVFCFRGEKSKMCIYFVAFATVFSHIFAMLGAPQTMPSFGAAILICAAGHVDLGQLTASDRLATQ